MIGCKPASSSSRPAVASLVMSSSAASTSSAVVCGVSHVGNQVVQTAVARRAPSATKSRIDTVTADLRKLPNACRR